MQLEDIFFARLAELGPDGLFNVTGGGMNRINAGSFPWGWGLLFLLTRFRVTAEEVQAKHTIGVERQLPGGHVEPVGESFPIPPAAPVGDVGPDGKLGLSFCFSLVNQQFPEAGIYKYRVKVDEEVAGVVELLLAGPAAAAQGQ